MASPTLSVTEPLDRTTIREAIADIEAAKRALDRIDLRRLRGNDQAKEAVRVVRSDLGDMRTELLQVI
jgi:hypothetical protein